MNITLHAEACRQSLGEGVNAVAIVLPTFNGTVIEVLGHPLLLGPWDHPVFCIGCFRSWESAWASTPRRRLLLAEAV